MSILDALMRVIPFDSTGTQLTVRGQWEADTGIEFTDDPETGRTLISATGSVVPTSPLTTKGDVYCRTSSADARLGVGANATVLTADSTAATGLKWATPAPTLPTRQYATASVTTVDGNAATASALSFTPYSGRFPAVYVNGVRKRVGGLTHACYFSADGGTTAVADGSIASGNTLRWNGSIAGGQLAGTEEILIEAVA